VITFLHEPTFGGCASTLDSKRLNKQLLEGRQILSAIVRGGRWSSHPATKMWVGHESLLVDYLEDVMLELRIRRISTGKNWEAILELDTPKNYNIPSWLDDPMARKAILVTHRGNLYNKDPEHYADYWREARMLRDFVCCAKCNYYWPSHKEEE
jgi:hypothetical protein